MFRSRLGGIHSLRLPNEVKIRRAVMTIGDLVTRSYLPPRTSVVERNNGRRWSANGQAAAWPLMHRSCAAFMHRIRGRHFRLSEKWLARLPLIWPESSLWSRRGLQPLQKVAEARQFTPSKPRMCIVLRYLGLGGAAYRTRTCDPRITKARLAFGISYMLQLLRLAPVRRISAYPVTTQSGRRRDSRSLPTGSTLVQCRPAS